MKDLKNGGQSKGYAFIAFETHESALNALRKLVSLSHLSAQLIDIPGAGVVLIEKAQENNQKSYEIF